MADAHPASRIPHLHPASASRSRILHPQPVSASAPIRTVFASYAGSGSTFHIPTQVVRRVSADSS
jgi:hypothetical protein